MKQIVKYLLVASASMVLGGITAKATPCDRLEVFALDYTAGHIVEDLLSGAWDAQLAGCTGMIYFRKDGKLDRVNTYQPRKHIHCAAWELEVVKAQAILHLTYPDGRVRQINLTPTCDGYAVQDLQGAIGTLNKVAQGSEDHLERAREQLTGTWVSTFPRKKVRGNTLKWEFGNDGIFTLTSDAGEDKTALSGVWDISTDGSNLLLFFTDDMSAENVYARETLTVEGMDFEDLVLRGETFGRLFGDRFDGKQFHFEKDTGA